MRRPVRTRVVGLRRLSFHAFSFTFLCATFAARTSSAHDIVGGKEVFVAPLVLLAPAPGAEIAPGSDVPVRGLLSFPFQFGVAGEGRARVLVETQVAFAGHASEVRQIGAFRYAFACNGAPGSLGCGRPHSDAAIAPFLEAGGGIAWKLEGGGATPLAHVGGGVLVPLDRDDGWPVVFVTGRATVRPSGDGPVAFSVESGLGFF